MAANNASSSMFSQMYSWGSSAVGYAQQQLNSMMGWEDMQVVDPDAKGAEKAADKASEGAVSEERKQAWGSRQFQQYIGTDVMSLLSVPVFIMEPISTLQKLGEMAEYAELLDAADACDDADERMALVAAFCVSPYGASDRAWKPFNPILGETFEMELPNSCRYVAEQVSHHPPVAAGQAQNEHFSYTLVSAPATRFLGNSLEIYPYGRTRVVLKRTGETYALMPPNIMVNNIVIGRTWVDHAGEMTVLNATTGAKAQLTFAACGWFGYGRWEVSGYVLDAQGTKKIKLSGKRISHLDAQRCNPDGTPVEGAPVKRLWTCKPLPAGDYYGFTHYTHQCNSSEGVRTPLPSDSRRRPDRAALAEGATARAQGEKHRLEEMQRAEKRERERVKQEWTPRFFRLVPQPKLLEGECDTQKVPFWESNGEYYKLPEAPAGVAAEIHGKGFNPWQFPSIHQQL